MDSVAPETPIRDIVDHCWVWESHADSDNRRMGRSVPERALPINTVSDANGRASWPGCHCFADRAGSVGETAQVTTPHVSVADTTS